MSDDGRRERDDSEETSGTPEEPARDSGNHETHDEMGAATDAGTSPDDADGGSEEAVEPDRADDVEAEADEPAMAVDPLDLSVPVASIAVTQAVEDDRGAAPDDPEDADGSDESAATDPHDVPRASPPGTWPGPGTGSVPAVPGRAAEPDEDHDDDPAAGPARTGGWRALVRAMRPRANRSQLLAAVLCAALGFALVVQVQQSAQDPLSSARQDDLVRLLDEVTQRSERLSEQVAELSRTRDELQSGTGQAQAAVELAEERAGTEGILSGRLPAVGPGVEIVVRDRDGLLDASKMFNVLEELRNAGAEVVELDGIRLVTSTWFRDTDDGIVVDGQVLDPPYRWTVIGDPSTLSPALEIPGGALATLRTAGAEATITEHDEVEVTAVREPPEPQYATPRGPGE